MTDKRQIAARLAGQSEMLDVRMVEASFRHVDFPEDGQITYKMDIAPSARLSESTPTLVTSADFTLEMRQEVDGEANDIANIQFTLAGLYSIPEDVEFSDEEVAAFADTTGIFGLYPYAREYVQDVTGRLGLPPLTLGLYKIPTTPAE